jgi:hypothetical protein
MPNSNGEKVGSTVISTRKGAVTGMRKSCCLPLCAVHVLVAVTRPIRGCVDAQRPA